LDKSGVWFTVVGVAEGILTWDLSDRMLPAAYLPYPHIPEREPRLFIRTAGDPALVAPSARTVINAFDPSMAVLGMRTMTEIHYEALSRQETLADLLAVLGGIALLLAATGVSGVLSYFVSQRTYEIGIRAALGADRRSLVRLFVRQGMAMTMGGTVLGLAGAWALTRVVRGRLHEVSPTDPLSFAGAALLLIGIVLIASYFPARRAASVDPLVAIRE
jgi:predicted lysophospholipase L1 biosynthesis ABC-type transport system permease subunit